MDDVAAFFCVCVLPLVGLGAFAMMLAASSQKSARERAELATSLLETRIARLEKANTELSARVAELAAMRLALPAPEHVAQATTETELEAPPVETAVMGEASTVPTDAHAAYVAPEPAWPTLAPYAPARATPEPAPEAPAVVDEAALDKKLDLEQWLGLRGAAVAGALVLIAAGAAFFQYSVEHGLLSVGARVVLGGLVGLGLMGLGELPLARPYARTSRLVQGAGAAIVYFAAWSASTRYGLVPGWVSMLAMVGVTAGTCFIAAKHDSLATAVLGLAGGFATPALLSTGSDRPIALFAYLGVLDFGLLYLSRRRNWGGLALFALCVTLLYECAWVITRMRMDRMPLGMLVVVSLGSLFALLAFGPEREDGEKDVDAFGITRVIAALSPFVFALHTSLASMTVEHTLMTASLVVLVHAATLFLARRQTSPFLALAGAASVAAVMVTATGHAVTSSTTTWPFALALVLSMVLHARHAREDDGTELLAATTFLVAFLRAVGPHREAVPVVLPLVAAAVAVLAVRAVQRARAVPVYMAAFGSALVVVSLIHAQRHVVDAIPENALPMASVLLAAALVALARRAPPSLGRHPEHASSLGITILLLGMSPWAASDCVTAVGVSATCVLLFSLGFASALSVPGWPVVLVGALAVPLLASTLHPRESVAFDALRATLLFVTAGVVSALPRLLPRAYENLSARMASALAPFMVVLPIVALYDAHFGKHLSFFVPAALSVVPAAVALPFGKRPLDLHHIVAVVLLAACVVIELDGNAVVFSWLALALGVAYTWRETGREHFGLVTSALVLAALLRALACALAPQFGRFYPFLSPLTLGFVGGALLLLAVAKQTDGVPRPPEPAPNALLLADQVGVATRIAALLMLFAFTSLVFRDAFGVERNLAMPFDRSLFIAVTTSLGYVAYACALVGVGIRREHKNLRATGLALFAFAAVKIFLWDLARLRDLYRVASLLGLAICLLLVSVAYQRFVLRAADR